MKWLIAFLIPFLILASPAFADSIDLDEQVYTAKIQTGAGIGLSILGTALGGGGIGAATSDQKGHNSAALGLGLSAAILCAVGIPLAIVGADKAKSLEKKRLALGGVLTF
jgi:hypothetical protein